MQRRIVIALAHELDDDAQAECVRRFCEETFDGEDVPWHACIHAPEGDNDARNWHAHVVWAQSPVEREPAGSRWTFERGATMPPPAPLARVLSGNGPQGRQGARDTVRAWRERVADLQNEALARAGATKRYDPRSYADQGRAETPGVHLGTVASAMERRERERTAESETAREAWERVGRLVGTEGAALEVTALACGLRAGGERGLAEALGEVAAAMARESGGDEAALRALVDASPPPAGKAEVARAVAAWRAIERLEPEEARRDAQAARLVGGRAPLAEAVGEAQGAPAARLRGALRRHRGRSARLAATLEATQEAPWAEREAALAAWRARESANVDAVLDRAAMRRLVAERARARRESVLARTARALVEAPMAEADAAGAALARERRAMARNAAPSGADETAAREAERLDEALDLRRRWEAASEGEDAGALAAIARAEAARGEAGAAARLSASLRAEIAAAGAEDGGAAALARARERRAVEREVAEGLGSAAERLRDPARVDRVCADRALRTRAERASAPARAALAGARRALSERRDRLLEAIEGAEAAVRAAGGEGLEALPPAEAARLYGLDPALLAADEPDRETELRIPVRRFAQVTARQAGKVARRAHGDAAADRAVLALADAPQRRALEALGTDVGERLARAAEREAGARAAALRVVGRRTREVRAAPTFEDRERARAALAAALDDERVLEGLGPARWSALARSAGLGADRGLAAGPEPGAYGPTHAEGRDEGAGGERG